MNLDNIEKDTVSGIPFNDNTSYMYLWRLSFRDFLEGPWLVRRLFLCCWIRLCYWRLLLDGVYHHLKLKRVS